MFCDASGFTALTEKLAQQPNGAERMCSIMNEFLTQAHSRCAAVQLHSDDKGLVRPVLEFFGRLRNEDVARGKAGGKLDLGAMVAATAPALEQAVSAGDN